MSKDDLKEEVPSGSRGAQLRSEKVEEKVELNVLLKFIKPFDGSRDKLNPFISNCQSAYNIANKTQKPILFRYILSQLIDRAETICSIKEFESFEQLVEFLKQQFGERKHYAHLLSELQDCKQGQNETVNQFALKIETCLAKLLTEIQVSIPTKKKSEIAGRVAAMEDLALHTFIIGLHPRLSQIVRCRDPDSLNAAVNFAVAEEKILSNAFMKKPTYFPNTDKSKFVPKREQPQYYRPQMPNQYRVSDTSKKVHTSDLVCRYCKNVGHTLENCRKRQYNNNRFANNFQPSTSGRQTNFNNEGQPRSVHLVQDNDGGYDTVDSTDLNE